MEIVLYTFHFNWLDCIWWLILLTLSGIFTGVWVNVRKSRQHSSGSKIARAIIPIFSLFCIVITVVWIGLSIFSYYVVKTQIASEKYSEVIGSVENFSPMPWSGHKQETFDINGISFSYSTYDIKPGYHTSSSWGGVITHNGQFLKIQYIGTDEYKVITFISEITK